MSSRLSSLCVPFALLFAAACGGSLPSGAESGEPASDALTVAGTLRPQSFVHGAVTSGEVAFALTGNAAELIALDVFPTGASRLVPTLTLLGPKGKTGHRAVVASGAPRGSNAAHLAIDGFRLPATGSYLAVVGAASGAGNFTLRLWMQSNHSPRTDSAQVDLQLHPSTQVQGIVAVHAGQSKSWGDSEVDSAVADIGQDADAQVAISDAYLLASSLATARSAGNATAAQVSRAQVAAAALAGSVRKFSRLPANAQAFALWWLGAVQPLVFTQQEVPAPRAVAAKIDALVAAWPGVEDVKQRSVRAQVLSGVVYGYVVDFAATQVDSDSRPVWTWLSREWFDAAGNWLGEQTAGATEGDDE